MLCEYEPRTVLARAFASSFAAHTRRAQRAPLLQELQPWLIAGDNGDSQSFAMNNKFHGQNLREGRHSQANSIYHITTVTHGRHDWFSDHLHARELCRSIHRSDQLLASSTLCFVVMPDHLHWLFMLGERYSLSHTINMLKSSSARRPSTAPTCAELPSRCHCCITAISRPSRCACVRAGSSAWT